VLAVAENVPQTEDSEVLAAAQREGRVLVTEDKDFGHLVRALGVRSSGVILLRFPATARATMAAAVVALCQRLGPALLESFVVLEPGRTRITRLPGK
jgi:predicted nuclease of predicted toxin-antitoxin system